MARYDGQLADHRQSSGVKGDPVRQWGRAPGRGNLEPLGQGGAGGAPGGRWTDFQRGGAGCGRRLGRGVPHGVAERCPAGRPWLQGLQVELAEDRIENAHQQR